MSFLSHVGNRGLTKSGSNATTVVAAVSTTIPVGQFLVVRVGNRHESHPADTETGETSKHVSVTDSKGNTYTKIAERSYPSAAFERGIAISLWLAQVTTELLNTDTVTATYDGSRDGRFIALEEYGAEESGSTVTVVGYATAANRGGTITVTLNATADEYTWIGAGYHSNRTPGALTVDSTFTNDRAPNILDNGSDDSGVLWGQYRHLFADTETWNHTLSDSSGRWALVLAALKVTPPEPAPAPEGTREYREDFETVSHHTVETSTGRRVDAISRDYRQAVCMGPVAINDASEGIEARRWHVRTDGTNVYVRRSNAANTAWEDDTLLFSVTGGEPINEIDVAFNIDGRIVVAMERPNGTDGAPRVNLYRYNTGTFTYQVIGVADGLSPRLTDDYFVFPYTAPDICPPEVYVQLFYMKPGAGMKRRSESNDWSTDNDTVVTALSTRRVEEVVKTVDHRISVLVSRRTIGTGRYTLERVDSLPYKDSAIRRPTFLNWTDPAFDAMQRGNSWRSEPSEGTTTAEYQLRVQTADACDAIEVAACEVYPEGEAPLFNVQEQEHTGTLAAGAFHDFTFEVTHGSGTSSVVGFRARIRRTVGEVTCYSPWRYTIFPADWMEETAEDVEVNCGYDLMVDLDRRMLWLDDGLVEGIRNTSNNSGGPCDDPLLTNADTQPGGDYYGYWFVGGELNTGPSFPFPTHFVRFHVRRRPYWFSNFVDDDGVRHLGVVVGEVMESLSASAPTKAFDWESDRFPRQFPDDTGLFPEAPASLDVIRST